MKNRGADILVRFRRGFHRFSERRSGWSATLLASNRGGAGGWKMRSTFKPRAAAAALLAFAFGSYAPPAAAYVSAFGNVTFDGPSEACKTGPQGLYNEGGPSAHWAWGFTGLLHGCYPWQNYGHGVSSGSEARGELKAAAHAGTWTTATAGATLDVKVILGGPAGATSVTDTFELLVNGTTSLPLQQPYPWPNLPTSGWSVCIRINSPGASPGSTLSPGSSGTLNSCTSAPGDGGPITHTQTLTFTVPLYTEPGASFARSEPILTFFTIRATAHGLYDPATGDTLVGDLDMSHTALIRQTLPAGFTFESDSGVFLTESPFNPPVPEPSTAVLLGCGLAGLTALYRNRRPKNQDHR